LIDFELVKYCFVVSCCHSLNILHHKDTAFIYMLYSLGQFFLCLFCFSLFGPWSVRLNCTRKTSPATASMCQNVSPHARARPHPSPPFLAIAGKFSAWIFRLRMNFSREFFNFAYQIWGKFFRFASIPLRQGTKKGPPPFGSGPQKTLKTESIRVFIIIRKRAGISRYISASALVLIREM
jgi:hypothetical protein